MEGFADKSTRSRPSIATICAASAVMVLACALAVASAMYTSQAYAAEAKAAAPTLEKLVCASGGTFGESAQSTAGGALRYRLSATLPQGVADLKTLDYTMVDVPNARIAVDASSATARVESASGTAKVQLACRTRLADGKLTVDLGDIIAACPSVTYGDRVVVEYEARVVADTPAGSYPNVAKLRYDDGSGIRETVEDKAVVTVPGPAASSTKASATPKTGDALHGGVALTAAAAVATAAAFAAARRTRDQAETAKEGEV